MGALQSADAPTARPVKQITPPSPEEKREERQISTTETDPRTELETACYALGCTEARRGWELEANEKTLKALEGRGAGMALAVHRPRSADEQNRKLKKLEELEAEIKRRVAARDRAKAVAQTRHRDEAALGPAEKRPEIPAVLRFAATLGLALSFAPTMHDLLTGLDPLLKWVVGGACAWGLGLLIIHGLLPTSAAPAETAAKEVQA